MRIDISKNWKYAEGVGNDEIGIPSDADSVDFPVDLLRRKNRNHNVALGIYGSYYEPVSAVFYRYLPAVHKNETVILEAEGVQQYADVCVNGVTAAHFEGAGKHFADITEFLRAGGKNLLTLRVWAPQMSGRYEGAGISGGVRLHTHPHGALLPEDSVYVVSYPDKEKAQLSVFAEIHRADSVAAKKTLTVETLLFNARGKRTGRKVRKIRLKNSVINECEIRFKLSRFYVWTPEDPYLYRVKVILRDEEGNSLDEQESTFGIVGRSLSLARGLVLNGRGVKLKGAVMAHDNGILGRESLPSAEEYKLRRIKEIGYNAVRYIGCPTEAVLDALDKIGLMAQVDLFPVWAQGAFPHDGHVHFAENKAADCERFVCQLRKHPCVTLYGLCGDAAETYERGAGSRTAHELAELVHSLDFSRPVVVTAQERVPLLEELEEAGVKGKPDTAAAAVSMGREKDIFGTRTAASFACADVAGYAYLYPRYSTDKNEFPERLIVGSASYPSRAYEAFEECEKNANVIGEFLYCGADYLGYPLGKPHYENEQIKLLPPHASYCGDLDLIYDRKPSAVYRSIMLGNRGVSAITVRDPEDGQLPDKAGHAVKETHEVWNWPHNLGKPVEIEVFSGGEVVALYRDGKLIGRKLAGRINKHIATFKADYYPGTLEAVSYHKGRECSRAYLSSVTSPRGVRLSAERKSQTAGELLFVEVAVVDKEGRTVPYASREVEISVTGQGELVAFGSADPESQTRTAGNTLCAVHNGKALAVVRALEDGDGKITVKATSDGLLSGKIALRVK